MARTNNRWRWLWLPLLGGVAAPGMALADPCKAIPDDGPMPAYLSRGSVFEGPAVYVGDGDSLCIAVGHGPQKWVEVRLADFYAPELQTTYGPQARQALKKITWGQRLECVASHQSHDRVVATCAIRGVSIGDRLREAGVPEGGNGR